jgi:phage regulator Rha-like protein
MSVLILIKDGEPVTTSLAIAEGTTNTHEAVIKLVRSYTADLEQFGRVRFEIQPFETAGGMQQREIALLNEQQSALVIAYMRNSEIVRQFKIALIKGFFDMRTQLSAQNSLAELPPEQRALVALMVDNARIKAQQQEIVATQESHTESIKRLEVKQSAFEDGAGYFTVIGYGAMHGIKIDHATAIRVGRRAGELSKRQGISVGKVRDVRFGQVNSYHESMLDAAFIEVGGAK